MATELIKAISEAFNSGNIQPTGRETRIYTGG